MKNIKPISGVSIATYAAGIKKNKDKDMALIYFYDPVNVAGVFTKNSFKAAPVLICQKKINTIKKPTKLALLINSGCANAGTGKQGIEDCIKSSDLLARSIGIDSNCIFPFSTGVILEKLPIKNILTGIEKLVSNLGNSSWYDAAEAIMTTDKLPKVVSKSIKIFEKKINIQGIAKGSGMIQPNMATMLAFIVTDLKISTKDLQLLVNFATAESFNCISVDGDTSTNDSFIAVSNCTSGIHLSSDDKKTSNEWNLFKTAFVEVCKSLAKSIVKDGEGATKFIEISVFEANSKTEASKIGLGVANSPLVKTAFFASDPNLGRILSAIGANGDSSLDFSKITVCLNDYKVIKNGQLVSGYDEVKAKKVMERKEINIRIFLGRGLFKKTFYTCDLSEEYVRINANYRT